MGNDQHEDYEWLTIGQLAVRAGHRRGKPVSLVTVRRWMRKGVEGVVLHSELDVGRRITSWEHYLEFRAEVARRIEAKRQRLRAAAKLTAGQKQRVEAATERLRERGFNV